jgi:hypothetical protein
VRRSVRPTFASMSGRRRGGLATLRERVTIFAFALGVLVAIVGLAFVAGYIVGKLIL